MGNLAVLSGQKRVLGLFFVPLALLATVGYFIASLVLDYDSKLQQERLHFLEAGLDHLLSDSVILMREMTDWDEAVEKVVESPNPDFIRENLQDYPRRVYGVHGAVILNDQFVPHVVYAENGLENVDFKRLVKSAPIQKNLLSMQQSPPDQYEPIADWVKIGGTIYEVSIGAFTRGRFGNNLPRKHRIIGVEDHLLMFLRVVDPSFLTALSAEYGLPRMTFDKPSTHSRAVSLTNREGEVVAPLYMADNHDGVAPILTQYGVLVVVIFLGIIAMSIAFFRRTQDYQRANAELNMLNDRMEDLVRNRTQELRRALEEAQKANQAKASFLSSMTHEFRTPLNSILGFTQLLAGAKQSNLSDSEQKWLAQIETSGTLMLSLVDDVLELAHLESDSVQFHWEILHPREVFQNCYQLIKPKAEERDIVLSGSPQASSFIRADRQRLHQVIMNLLSNAVKYNREGGAIAFGCSMVGDKTIRLEITDTGMGMSKTEQAHAFEPFYRGENVLHTIEGTGVGLTLVKMMTQAMGGTITLKSELNQGTSIYLDFPAVDRPAP